MNFFEFCIYFIFNRYNDELLGPTPTIQVVVEFFDDLNNCQILCTANMRPNTYPRLFVTCYKYQ